MTNSMMYSQSKSLPLYLQKYLQKDSFDIVMFPVDGRIGNGYT